MVREEFARTTEWERQARDHQQRSNDWRLGEGAAGVPGKRELRGRVWREGRWPLETREDGPSAAEAVGRSQLHEEIATEAASRELIAGPHCLG